MGRWHAIAASSHSEAGTEADRVAAAAARHQCQLLPLLPRLTSAEHHHIFAATC